MEERYLGAKILSWVYLVLIAFVYIFIYFYIIYDVKQEQSNVQSLILVLITSFIGTYSKQYYESMVYMIYNFEPDKVPNEINRAVLKSFAVTNWFTLMLLSLFFSYTLKGQVNSFALLGVIAIPNLLYLVGFFFNFANSED